MNKRKCLILKENQYSCNDTIIKEIEKKIRYLIKCRNVTKFYIEEGDYLSKTIIKSINNKVLINKIQKKKINNKFLNKLTQYKIIIKKCDYIIIIGSEFYESNMLKFYMNLNFDNIRYFFIDRHYYDISNSIRFE